MNKNKIIQILFIIILIMNLVIFFKIEDTNNRLENINESIVSLNNRINEVASSISQVDKFVVNLNTNVDVKDISAKGYILNVDASFNELVEAEEPYIAYRSVVNDTNTYTDWIEVKLEKKAPLTYGINLALSFGKGYEYKVVTGGAMQRSSDLYNIASDEYDPIGVELLQSTVSSKSSESIFNVYNKYNLEEYEVDKVTVSIPAISKVYECVKVKSEAEKYGIKPDGIVAGNYKIEVPEEDYAVIKGQSTLVEVEIVCKNGFKTVKSNMYMKF